MNIEQLREMMREGIVVETSKAATAKRLAGEIWSKIPEAEKAEARAEIAAEGAAEAAAESKPTAPTPTAPSVKVLETKVLYYRDDKSDKVYKVVVEERIAADGATSYQVHAEWGRYGKRMQCQVKGTFMTRANAYREYTDTILSKKRKGYGEVRR